MKLLKPANPNKRVIWVGRCSCDCEIEISDEEAKTFRAESHEPQWEYDYYSRLVPCPACDCRITVMPQVVYRHERCDVPPLCDCLSYNKPEWGGIQKEVVLSTPSHIEGHPNGICVDACIADVIQELWKREVNTLGCCCGHNQDYPSVVIANEEDAEQVKKILSDIDERQWKVMQWRLVTC